MVARKRTTIKKSAGKKPSSSTRGAQPSGSNYPAAAPGTRQPIRGDRNPGGLARAARDAGYAPGRGYDSNKTWAIYESRATPRVPSGSSPRASYPAAPASTRKSPAKRRAR